MVKRYPSGKQLQRGSLMIEVLVTMVIMVIGLWGMASVQARLQVSEVESYQRAQALLLLNDMASRVATNRTAAATYVTTAASPLGAGMSCPSATSTRRQIDAREWCNALQGAAETLGAGSNRVGALIGGRGCVEALPGNRFLITVAWQGMTPISAPPGSVACGQNAYDGAEPCVNDLCRRAITTIVSVPTL